MTDFPPLTPDELATLKDQHDRLANANDAATGYSGPSCLLCNEPYPCRVGRLIRMYEREVKA